MQNTKRLIKYSNPTMDFDIKGSTIKRNVKLSDDNDMFWKKITPDFRTSRHEKKLMKDLNWVKINRDLNNCLIRLNQNQYDEVKEMIDLDSKFLES